MFLPIFGPYFPPLWLFPYFKGPFLLVQLFCFSLCLFTLLKKSCTLFVQYCFSTGDILQWQIPSGVLTMPCGFLVPVSSDRLCVLYLKL